MLYSEIDKRILDKIAPGDQNSLTEQSIIAKAITAVQEAGLLNEKSGPPIISQPVTTPLTIMIQQLMAYQNAEKATADYREIARAIMLSDVGLQTRIAVAIEALVLLECKKQGLNFQDVINIDTHEVNM